MVLKLRILVLEVLDFLLSAAAILLELILLLLGRGGCLNLRLLDQVFHLAELLVTGLQLMLEFVLLPYE